MKESSVELLKYLIEDYADIRCELVYLSINNSLTDIIDTKEYKDIQNKKNDIEDKMNKILNELDK